jgi:hypothetical protein
LRPSFRQKLTKLYRLLPGHPCLLSGSVEIAADDDDEEFLAVNLCCFKFATLASVEGT